MNTVPRVTADCLRNMRLKNAREFKKLKRQQLRDINDAVSQYRRGCAYCPGQFDIIQLQTAVDNLVKSHSVREWGR